MVKSLSDVCLDFIRCNIDRLGFVCSCLTHQQKEVIIQRFAIHEQLTLPNKEIIFKNLFVRALKDISLENCMQVDDSFLQRLASCGCKLNSIYLSNCKNVTDKGLGLLLNTQQNLNELSLKSLVNVTGKCFENFSSPNLWCVKLKGTGSIDCAGLSHLVQNCRNISHLNLGLCSKLDDTAIDCVAGFLLGKLESLNCAYLPLITDQSLISLADRCLNLKQLKLHGCSKVKSVGVRAVFKACTLSIVDLSYCYTIVGKPDILSDSLPETLGKVVLRGTQVDRMFINAFSLRCKNLQMITLCGIQSLGDEAVCEMLERIGHNIKELDFSWCNNITDVSLKAIIACCPNISSMNFICCKAITGEALMQYAQPAKREQAAKLRRLGFGACPNLECGVFLDIFPYCKNLEDIRASGHDSFCDDYLLSLAKNCPKLKEIGIKGCAQVTDKGVCELVRYCTSLRCLVLSGLNLLTDLSIFFMASSIASTLSSLYISGCSKISHHTVTYLKDVCIHHLFVEHKTPNASPNQLMARNLDTGEFCRADLL
eukprot:gene5409-6085_t